MARDNKAISRQFIERVWNEGNLEAIDDLTTADVVLHDRDAGDHRGHEAVRAFVKTFKDAFPDSRYSIDEQIADGDTVVTRWTARGTHTGELMDIPPTGRNVIVSGTSIDHLADGRIRESTASWDALGMMQQIGAVPERGRPRD
jgi:steroid delta-isomerase-like uncharacterized protein